MQTGLIIGGVVACILVVLGVALFAGNAKTCCGQDSHGVPLVQNNEMCSPWKCKPGMWECYKAGPGDWRRGPGDHCCDDNKTNGEHHNSTRDNPDGTWSYIDYTSRFPKDAPCAP